MEGYDSQRSSLSAYPMPPETLYLPGLAALLNPLKIKSPKSTTVSLPRSTSLSSIPTTPNSTGARTARCRICLGCQAPPCGKCGYCKDSIQFGGPGVKKQTCVERKCVALIENRIQKDPTPIKSKPVCNKCEGCLQPDCQNCLVCYDKKFLDGKYLNGAICNKKKCVGNLGIDENLKELKNLQQQKRRQSTRQPKKTLKLKMQEENAEEAKPPPKPKRKYQRRKPRIPTVSSPAPLPPPPSTLDEKAKEVEVVTIEDDDDNNLAEQVHKQSPQSYCTTPKQNLSPISNATQSPSEIQRYNPPQYLMRVPQSPINSEISKGNQNIQMRKPWTYKVRPNPTPNYQALAFHQSPPDFPQLRFYRRRLRYVRFSNNADFNSSSTSPSIEFDPFIPPSYSGNEEVILQAL